MKTLKPYNTFGLDRQANNIVTVGNPEELLEAWQNAKTSGQPVVILGEGSNILFLEDFHGTVILNQIKGIQVEEQETHWVLHVGAGENWHKLVKYTLEKNMPGLENLALIPGCVGSAPIQNIGAYGVEFKQFCDYVDCIQLATGKTIRLNNSECCFSYRESIFKHAYKHYAIVAIGISLPKNWTPSLNYGDLAILSTQSVTPQKVFDAVCQTRRNKLPDPEITDNAGSFFKNPVISADQAKKFLSDHPSSPRYSQADGTIKLAAGWLIDKCGLKGFKIGGASVHENQALVIINEDNASSEDIVSLARHVRNTVGQKFNIWLEPEVRFIGRHGEVDAVKTLEKNNT